MRAKRSAFNFASSVGMTLMVTVASFAATPLLVEWLGAERFGAFRAAHDWLGHLMIVELGIGGALLPILAKALLGGAGEVKAVLTAGMRVYVRAVVRMALAGGLVLAVITRLIPVSPAASADLRLGFGIGLVALLALPLTPIRVLLESQQRSYVVNALLGAQNLATLGLALWFAAAGYGVTGQFAAQSIGAVVFGLALVGLGARYLRGPAIDDRTLTGRIAASSRPNFIFSLCGKLMYTVDNIVVAVFWGPVTLVPFFLTQRLANVAQVLLQAVGNAVWASLAEIHFQGQRDLLVARLLELTKIVGILAGATLVPIAAYNSEFVRLWVGAENYGGLGITILASVNAALLALSSLWGWAIVGTGHVDRIVPRSVAATLVNTGLTLALVPTLGPIGALVGTTTGHLAVNVWQLPRLVEELFGRFARDVLRFLVALTLVGGCSLVLLLRVAAAAAPLSWLGLGVHLAVSGAGFVGVAAWLLLSHAERAGIATRLRAAYQRPAGPGGPAGPTGPIAGDAP